jgi:hypothetical protein
MNPQILLNRPKPQIVPKITKISGLVDSSNEIKRSSTKLRKVFEKGTYQKKTQLTTLNRYKKRLDAIQKQNDKRFSQKSKVKIKLPDIKKYAGSFFTAGSTSDPLKSIAALSAFNSASKAGKGDWLGAVGPGLIAAGLLFGPGLIKGGIGKMFGGGRGTNAPMSGGIKSPKALSNKQLSRVNQSYARFISKDANLGDKFRLAKRGYIKPGQIFSKGGPEALASGGGKVAKAFGKFGASIIPGIGAVVGAADATLRAQSGDTTGAAIAGAGAGLDAFAAASAATGIGLPLAGLASIASFGLDVTNLIRDLSGASDREIQKNKTTTQLKEQTKKQKESTKKKPDKGGVLTFRKTLNSYEKSVNKFEEFAKGFKGAMGMNEQQVRETAARIEDLGGGSSPISAAGYEFTNESSFSQYLTGDPNAPGGAYDPSHGTVSNYHDHLAFKDVETTRRAYNFLQSKGIEVTELGVTSGHTAGSAHYEGRAFDVPGAQWGGSPGSPIGQREYAGSAKVRAFMNDFYNSERQRSKGPDAVQTPRPSGTPQPSRPSTAQQLRSLGQNAAASAAERQQSLFSMGSDIIDEIIDSPPPPKFTSSVKQRPSIASYASYDSRSQAGQIIPLPIPIPQQQMQQMMPSGSSGMMMSGPSEQDLLNSFYKRVLLNTV